GVLRVQRADRADVDDIAGPVRVIEPLVEEGVDHRTVPALDDTEGFVPLDFAHEADAAGAHDAAAPLVEDVAAEVVAPEDALRLEVTPVLAPLLVRVVLELALPRLVADRTVEGVVGQVELEDALPRLGRLLGLGIDHLPIRDRGH